LAVPDAVKPILDCESTTAPGAGDGNTDGEADGDGVASGVVSMFPAQPATAETRIKSHIHMAGRTRAISLSISRLLFCRDIDRPPTAGLLTTYFNRHITIGASAANAGDVEHP
jgi:hypothetical protein